MKDLPFFTTELGIASLTLSQIPYTKQSYIRIQDSCEPNEFLEECVSFCRTAGAECVFATGHRVCEQYPQYTKLISMQADRLAIGETDAALFPVTSSTLNKWIEIYNQKVIRVPNGAWMTSFTARKMLQDGDGYFVHKDGELLGIGKASGNEIAWIAAIKPGAGADVMRALCHALTEETVSLVVSSQNHKALRLYEMLGFVCTGVVSTWYTIRCV